MKKISKKMTAAEVAVILTKPDNTDRRFYETSLKESYEVLEE